MKHEEWYRKYLMLKDRNRNALKNWRSTKVLNKTTISRNNDGLSVSEEDGTIKVKKCLNKNIIQDKLALWKVCILYILFPLQHKILLQHCSNIAELSKCGHEDIVVKN